MSNKLKTVLAILCPIVGIVAGVIAIANAILDRKTKKKQLEAWSHPDTLYQNIGVGMEYQRYRQSKQNKNA